MLWSATALSAVLASGAGVAEEVGIAVGAEPAEPPNVAGDDIEAFQQMDPEADNEATAATLPSHSTDANVTEGSATDQLDPEAAQSPTTAAGGGRAVAATEAMCNFQETPPLAIGDTVTLCVFLSTTPPKKMVFRIKVEEYAELFLKGSQALALANKTMPVHTWVAASSTAPADPLDCTSSTDRNARSGQVSCPQIYVTSSHLVHLANLVINMRGGRISSFAWDNGCQGCGPGSCMESSKKLDLVNRSASGAKFSQGACGAEKVGCAEAKGTCDLKIMVTWAGTDRKGRHATSAGMRLSKFTGYTLKSLYEKINDNYGSVTGD